MQHNVPSIFRKSPPDYFEILHDVSLVYLHVPGNHLPIKVLVFNYRTGHILYIVTWETQLYLLVCTVTSIGDSHTYAKLCGFLQMMLSQRITQEPANSNCWYDQIDVFLSTLTSRSE